VENKKKRPNVILILTDDQGYWALGCYGNKEIRTPNIDSLAEKGIRFEHFFCTSPVCSPARASLLTGRIPSQHGVHDWIRTGNGDRSGQPPIEYLEGITGYTELMANAGYTCGISGKWHMGASNQPQKGYSYWYVAKQAGAGTYIDSDMFLGTEIVPTKGYLTDVITDGALRFIDECCDAEEQKPFYLNLAYTAPHSPLVDQHPKEYVEHYLEHCTFESAPQDPKHPWSPEYPVEIQYSEKFADSSRTYVGVRDLLAGYYAAIQGVDDGVGRVLRKLEERGIRENTLVVFMSDNGFNCGHHGIWGKGNATFPLNLYDTSVKVPCIFSMPGVVRENVSSDALLSGYDFMPTLLDFLHIDNPDSKQLPGRSFLPILLTDDSAEYRESVTVYDEYGKARMVRTKEWKYIRRYPDGPDELYDLVNDPGEYHNLLHENRIFMHSPEEIKEKAQELGEILENWYRVYADPGYDGVKEDVFGRGQIAKLEEKAEDQLHFHPLVKVEYTRST